MMSAMTLKFNQRCVELITTPLCFRRRLLGLLLIWLISSFGFAGVDAAAEISDALCGKNQYSASLPVFSDRLADGLSIDEAYHLQRMAITECLDGQRPKGFKAGLTNPVVQNKFGVKSAVAGVLLPGMVLHVRSEEGLISAERFHNGKIEVELAFFLKQSVSQPIQTLEELKSLLAGFAPAIELPDLRFQKSKAPVGTDIVASNIAPKMVLIGKTRTLSEIPDINAVAAKLIHNGLVKQYVAAGSVMGDQLGALLWLINHMVEQGYTIPPDVPLLTGNMGQLLPLENGIYKVEFSGFEPFVFVVD